MASKACIFVPLSQQNKIMQAKSRKGHGAYDITACTRFLYILRALSSKVTRKYSSVHPPPLRLDIFLFILIHLRRPGQEGACGCDPSPTPNAIHGKVWSSTSTPLFQVDKLYDPCQ